MWKTQTGKPQAAASKESIIVIRTYKIDIRVMCSKKRSISNYILLTKFLHTKRNSKINKTMNAPKGLNDHRKCLRSHQIRLNDLVFI